MTVVLGGLVIPDLASDHSIVNGAIVISGDEIVSVESYPEAIARFPAARQVGKHDHIVIPGLVNAHHHGYGLTSFQQGVPDDYLEPWLIDLRSLAPSVDIYLDTLFSTINLLRSGVTTVLHAGVPRGAGTLKKETASTLQAYDASGVRVAYAVQIQDQNRLVYQQDQVFIQSLPPTLRSDVTAILAASPTPSRDDFWTVVEDALATYADHPRIKILLCPFAPQWCSDSLLGEICTFTDRLQLGIHMHALETRYQREYGFQTYQKGVIEHLAELGLLGPRLSIAHGVWMTEREIELCAAAKTTIVHNPSSNLRLRSGILPLPLLFDKGVNVAIGLDCMSLNDDEDVLQELRLTAQLHRLPQHVSRAPLLGATDILGMATVNGAHVVGEHQQIGRLEPGMKADLVLLNAETLYYPYVDDQTTFGELLLHRGKASHVDTVVVGGEILMENKVLTRVDERSVARELAASVTRDSEAAATAEIMSQVRRYAIDFYSTWRIPPPGSIYHPHSVP